MKKYIILSVLIIYTALSFGQISGSIRFNSDDFNMRDTVGGNSVPYTYFSSNPYEFVETPGLPCLPTRYERFILPYGMKIDSIVVSVTETDTLSLNHYIFPVQKAVASCIGCPVPDFQSTDTSVYYSATSFPGNIAEEDSYGYWHTANIVTVAFYPYQYYPSSNKLIFKGTLQYSIFYSLPAGGISKSPGIKMKNARYERFVNQLGASIINPGDIATFLSGIDLVPDGYSATHDSAEYIVIAPENFIESQAMKDFVLWKKKRGINTEVISISNVYEQSQNWVDDIGNTGSNSNSISDNAAKLRKYLQYYYQNAGAEWILLVGDENLMPVRYFFARHTPPEYLSDTVITDKYFADFNSDYEVDGDGKFGEWGPGTLQDEVDLYPESYIGRILCSNLQEFTNWVSKLINYETNPGNGETGYLKRFNLTMADQFQKFILENPAIYNNLNIFNTTTYIELPAYNSTPVNDPYGSAVIAGLNLNPGGWWTWSNHGSYYRFATMTDSINGVERSSVNTGTSANGLLSLSNTYRYGIIHSGCCSIASFGTSSVCMAQEVLTAPLKGCVAISGCTDLSWIEDENTKLNKFTAKIRNSHDGSITTTGHAGVLEWTSNTVIGGERNYETYLTHNFFGDPEMMYYTKEPIRFVANASPGHIDKTQNNTIIITINNLAAFDTAILSLYKAVDNYQFAEYQRTKIIVGKHDFVTDTFNIPANVLGQGHLFVTVSGFSYLPYTSEIIVSPGCTYYPDSSEHIRGTPFPWIQVRFKNHDVIIDSAATLTISGEVYFVPEARIIVKPGGKLAIDGGKLSTSCETLWKGVEVWGNNGQMQTIYNQGSISVINGGSICDANCGVRTIKLVGINTYPATSGGIVSCSNAIFKNNKVAVRFYAFNYLGRFYNSSFTNSQFMLDDKYIGLPSLPDGMVYMSDIFGLSFKGCLFENNMTSVTNLKQRGYGIKTSNGGFTVDKLCISVQQPCSLYQNTRFKGLAYGIHSSNYSSLYPVSILNSEFSGNYRSAYLSAVNAPSINNNIFQTRIGSVNDTTSGLYLNACTGFSVQENSFVGHYNGVVLTYETGLVINNSGIASNEIYNNKFDSLTNGITAQDNNLGLVCKCNDYSSVKTDQSVLLSNGAPTTWGIALYQGDGLSVSGPAGNTFSLRTSGTGDIYNEGKKFNYYHHQDNAQFRLEPKYYEKVDLIAYIDDNYTKQTACPSKLGGGGGINQEQIKNEMASTGLLIEQKEDSLVELIDGGNTEETTEDVVYSSPQEALNLRDDLLTKSPYLSDTVMQTAVANEFVLPNSMVRDILVANPQSATSDPVLDELDKRVEPMPDEMYNQILDGELVLAPKEAKEAELASLKLARETNYNTLVSYYIADTTGTLSDSLDQLLMSENKPEARYLLACKQISEGDTTAAGITLAAIPAEFNLSPAEMNRHENYLSYFAVVGSMDSDTLPGYECDSLQLSALTLLMEEECEPVSSYSRNLLIANGVVIYNEPYLIADELKSTLVKRERRNVATNPEPMLTLSPNPCRNFVIVGYSLENNSTSDAFLTISTLQGVEMNSIRLNGSKNQIVISLNNFKPGVYVASLKAGGKLMDSKKIIVVNNK